MAAMQGNANLHPDSTGPKEWMESATSSFFHVPQHQPWEPFQAMSSWGHKSAVKELFALKG